VVGPHEGRTIEAMGIAILDRYEGMTDSISQQRAEGFSEWERVFKNVVELLIPRIET